MFGIAIGFLIQLVLWVSIVISPVLLFMLIGMGVHLQGWALASKWAIPTSLMLGVLVGVYWAEVVRRRIGLLNFWGSLFRNSEFRHKP